MSIRRPSPIRFRPGRLWRVTVLVSLSLLPFVLPHLRRRQTSAERWLAEYRQRGERLQFADLGFRKYARYDPVIEELHTARPLLTRLELERLPRPDWSSEISAGVHRVVLWNEPWFLSPRHWVLDWSRLEAAVEEVRPALRDLHEVLREHRREARCQTVAQFLAAEFMIPHELAMRLHIAVMVDLHRGNLGDAHTNLLSLFWLSSALETTRTRSAELCAQTAWQALQHPGWSETQLAAWQAALDESPLLDAALYDVELERVRMDHALLTWVAAEPPPAYLDFVATRSWTRSRWVAQLYDRAWRVFRCDRDRLALLEGHQRVVEAHRELLAGAPFVADRFDAAFKPGAMERLLAAIDPQGAAACFLALRGSFLNASTAREAQRLETQRRLALTALALERHRLRHGAPAATLDELVPECLPAIPRDAFAGTPLHYAPPGVNPAMLHTQEPGPLRAPPGKPPASPDPVRRMESATAHWPWPLLRQAYPPAPPAWALATRQTAARSPASPAAEVIPEVAFEDVTLAHVVDTLASQAGIALFKDPLVDLGSSQYPHISVRLENVTALAALEAIVKNQGLRLVQDPMTAAWCLMPP